MSDKLPEWIRYADVGSTRLKTKKRRRKRKVSVKFGKRVSQVLGQLPIHTWAAGLAVLAALCLGLWFGLRSVGGVLFADNAMFTIQKLEMESGDRVAREYLRGKLKIDRGQNLFGISINEARSEFLRNAPNYRAMEITRILPDTLKIDLIERQPVLRFGREGGFVVDGEGFVFGPRRNNAPLPLLLGYKGPSLRPGEQLQGIASEAVSIVEFCQRGELGDDVLISSIDVAGGFGGRKESIRLNLRDRTSVDLWWSRSRAKALSEDLMDRLTLLRSVLKNEKSKGRRPRSINLTLDDYRRNIPIAYWD